MLLYVAKGLFRYDEVKDFERQKDIRKFEESVNIATTWKVVMVSQRMHMPKLIKLCLLTLSSSLYVSYTSIKLFHFFKLRIFEMVRFSWTFQVDLMQSQGTLQEGHRKVKSKEGNVTDDSHILLWELKWHNEIGKEFGSFLKLNLYLQYDPDVCLQIIYLKEKKYYINKGAYLKMFIAALFIHNS
jgi:hypothetical protein